MEQLDIECVMCLDTGEFFVVFDEDTGEGHWMDCPHSGLDDLALVGIGGIDG